MPNIHWNECFFPPHYNQFYMNVNRHTTDNLPLEHIMHTHAPYTYSSTLGPSFGINNSYNHFCTFSSSFSSCSHISELSCSPLHFYVISRKWILIAIYLNPMLFHVSNQNAWIEHTSNELTHQLNTAQRSICQNENERSVRNISKSTAFDSQIV